MAAATTVKKTFNKYSFVSTKLDAKVLVNGKIKSANSESTFKSLKLVLTATNQLGKTFNSLNSGLVKLNESITKVSSNLVTESRKEAIGQKKILRLSSQEIKDEKKRTDDEKSSSRRQLDKKSEDRSETGDPLGLKKETEKKVIKPSLGIFDVLKNFAQLLIKYAVVSGVLKWMMDPNNTEKLGKLAVGLGKVFKFFWDITSAVGGLIAGGVANLGAGIFDTAQGLAKGDVGQVFKGLGQFVQAIPGLLVLRWVLNPMSLIKDITGVLNTIGLGDKPEKPPTPDGRKPPKPASQRRVGATRRYIRREFNKGVGKTADTLNKIPGKLGDAFKSGMGWLGDKTKGVRSGVGKGIDWVSEQYKRMAKMGDSISKGAMDKLKGAGKAIQKKAAEVAKPLMDTAKRILDEKGITKMAQQLGTKAMNVIKKLPGYDKITKKIAQEGGEGMLKKLGGKAIPVIGGLVNLYFAYDRLKRGDKTGAILEAISAVLDIAGLVTGGSTSVASMVIDGYLFGRDFFPDMVKKENETFDSILGFLNPIKAAQKILPQVPKFEKGGIVGPNGQKVDPKILGSTIVDTTSKTISNLGPGGQYAESVLGGEISQLKTIFGESNILISQSKLSSSTKKSSKDLTNKLVSRSETDGIKDLMGEKNVNITEGKVNSDTSVVGLFASVVGVLAALVNKDFKIGEGGSGGGGGAGPDGASAEGDPDVGPIQGGPMHQKGANIAKKLMSLLNIKDYQAAGIVGNLIQESSLVPDRIQGSGMKRGPLKLDGVTGYSYPQWTSIDRQKAFASYMESKGFDWRNKGATDEMATGFLAKEFKGYMSSVFKNTKDVASASTWVLRNYEKPADQGSREASERAADSKAVLDKMAGGGTVREWNQKRTPRGEPIRVINEAKNPQEGGWNKFAAGGKFKNGQLPESELEPIGSGHKLHKSVAKQAKAMFASAKNAGHGLGQGLRINSSYRSYQRQKELYDQLGPGTAARPGTSNHGLGLAMDLWFTDGAFKWLKQNAPKFGFDQIPAFRTNNPDGHEAWHWENVSGKGSIDGGAGSGPSSGDSGTPDSGGDNQQQSAPAEQWWTTLGKALSGQTAAELVGKPAETTPTTPTAEPPKKAAGGVVDFSNPSFGVDKQNKLNVDSFTKSPLKTLTPMQQWAKAHPQLAKKVKPGQSGYAEIQAVINPTPLMVGMPQTAVVQSVNQVIKESPRLPDENMYTKNKVLILNNFRTNVVQAPGPQIVRTTSTPQACYDSFFNN